MTKKIQKLMGDLSKNFSRSEFACKCGCGFDTVDIRLLDYLEAVRKHFNQKITINSGCRCMMYNVQIGGSDGSQHLKGRAADIVVEHNRPFDVHKFLGTLNPNGLGLYKTFVHVDSRSHENARWDRS